MTFVRCCEYGQPNGLCSASGVQSAADLVPMRYIAIKSKPKKDGGGWTSEDF
jgi:hypothetical protein